MNIPKILNKIRPGATWCLDGMSYDGLIWQDESPKPTKKEIEKAWAEVREEIDRENVQRLRRGAYEKESDPIFFKYQRGEAEKQEWLDLIEEIKQRYPYTEFSQE
jgi:hypothetical protein